MKPIIKVGTVGTKKGRLQRILNEFLRSHGIEIPTDIDKKYVYYIPGKKCDFEVLLMDEMDIIENYKDFDLLIHEAEKWLVGPNKKLVSLEYLELEGARLSILVPKEKSDYPLSYFVHGKIATAFPNVLMRSSAISDKNLVVKRDSVKGSVNAGWATAVFDYIETGETARANGLVEFMKLANYGAVIATPHPERIKKYIDLEIIKPNQEVQEIAFDGIDGSGKSTLSRALITSGCFSGKPVAFVEPFSIDTDESLKRQEYDTWAERTGWNYFPESRYISTIYDGSVLTAIACAGAQSEEMMIKAIKCWQPLPDHLFYCRITPQIAYNRYCSANHSGNARTLKYFEEERKRYDRAVTILRTQNNVKVTVLDATLPVKENIEHVISIISKTA